MTIFTTHVEKILKAAGAVDDDQKIVSSDNGNNAPITTTSSTNNHDEAILKRMEAWLGLVSTSTVDDDQKDVVTVEDCLPLKPEVFNAAVAWLVDAWNNNNDSSASSKLLGPSAVGNPLLDQQQNSADDDTNAVSLYTAFYSVRATKWLRVWMEFNLQTSQDKNNGSKTDENASLCAKLLQVDRRDDDNNGKPASSKNGDDDVTTIAKTLPKNALLRALFKHIQDLPILQQQLLQFSQHLQRADPHSMVSSSSGNIALLKDPKTRLQQYERAQTISTRLQVEWQEHVEEHLQCITAELYRHGNANQRKLFRRLLGQVWSQFVLLQQSSTGFSSVRQENTRAAGIRMTLQVLRRILMGANSLTKGNELSAPLHHLLFHQLIPLHQPDGIVLWRDQTAVLELYHEPLCQCMGILLQQQPKSLIPPVITQLLQTKIFPLAGNTPKQVLLLHEIDTYLRLLVPDDMSDNLENQGAVVSDDESYLKEEKIMMQALYQTLARCMSSEHSRVAERALQFFQNKSFEQLVTTRYLEMGLQTLLPALVKREPSWNPTVRKMTYNVLKKLQGYDEKMFESISNHIFSDVVPVLPDTDKKTGRSIPKSSIEISQTREAAATRSMAPAAKDFSLKSGMGNWRPPHTVGGHRTPGSMPPPTSRPPPPKTTGISNPPGKGAAPWAMMPPANKGPATQPPLTVTGVAPWAMNQPIPAPSKSYKRDERDASMIGISEDDEGSNSDDGSGSVMSIEEGSMASVRRSGLEHVLAYMEKIKPPAEEEGVSSWSKAQMAETPTYLPELKFHDLVFGHDLGTGAFGSVRYARLIDKTKPRSQWPEYAVKIVSTEKIRALGYEASIQREIAVLRVLSHPGIARLVSSFRFHDGAYLVLEYASRGDLHTLLQKHGSLDLDSTRFVIGEVVAALASIHDMGFVYGDLKPENIVITEPGHIKLTDFGGCRPLTEEAKTMMQMISKDILKNLRDGDWKARPSSAAGNSGYESSSSNSEMDEQSNVDKLKQTAEEQEGDDMRIEGTTAYLPPEVVMGAFPTTAADSWALGCVMYQCLSGRPPLLEADDEATKNRIVSFDVAETSVQSKSELDRLFEDKHASGISSEARDMIRSLLDRDALKRPGMNELAEHSFFTSNVFELYSQPAYPLDVGNVSPTPNAQWARRQFSSIWAPQPEAYDISMPDDFDGMNGDIFSRLSCDAPIPEGEESSGYFSPSGKPPHTAAAASHGSHAGRAMLLPPS